MKISAQPDSGPNHHDRARRGQRLRKVDIGGGNVITANITEEAIADLGLTEGDTVTVLIKASDVLIGK